MIPLKVKKGFTLPLTGMPDLSVIRLPQPETVAVPVLDIPYIRPKILVKEKDPVRIGTPLFCDKRNKNIRYLSPGAGMVKQIIFGPRRRLVEIVVTLDKMREGSDSYLPFDPISSKDLEQMPRSTIVEHLQNGGLWQCFRQFPAKDTADENHIPSMIIVSMNGNDLFSPHPQVVLDSELNFFELGIRLLEQLTRNIIVTCRENSLNRLNGFTPFITHVVPDTYPAWDPGTVLYKLKQSVEDNASWCISAEHLVLIGKFFINGRYPVKRVVTVTRSHDKKPHIITRQGAPIKDLTGGLDAGGLITTGRFNGRSVAPDSHLGFFETTLNILPGSQEDEMFGFLMPGVSKASVSKTFLSSLAPGPMDLDCTLHGEERACINCGYCTRICPVDLNPNFIMKALHADDIEDALQYGLLDCVRCGLCSYTCPSKIELTRILSDGMNAHFKDKE